MKNPLTLLAFLFLPCLATSQVTDTLMATQQFDSLRTLSKNLQAIGKFDEAWAEIQKAEEIALRVFGELSEQYISACHNKGVILLSKGQKDDFEESKGWIEKAIALLTELYGEEHIEQGTLLGDLGILYYHNEQWKKAEEYFDKALKITVQAEGKNSINYFSNLNSKAVMHWQLGQYEEAEKKFKEALDILSAILQGKPDANLIISLNNYGTILRVMGDYEKALPALEDAVGIADSTMDKRDPNYGTFLSNLAETYENLGMYDRALPLFLASIENAVNSVGKKHQLYGLRANNLGHLYMRMKRYDEGIEILEEAAEMFKVAKGEAHNDYVKCIHNIARAYFLTGRGEEAESLYQTALSTVSKTLGTEHPYHANFQNSLANLYTDQKKYKPADSLYQTALNVQVKVLGKTHPQTLRTFRDFAVLNWERKIYPRADSLFAETAALQQTALSNAARHLPEGMLDKYAATFSEWLNTLYSYCQASLGGVGYLPRTAYDASLFHKGFVLHQVRLMHHVAKNDSSAYPIYERHRIYSHLLAQEESKPAAARQKVSEYKDEVETLEKSLKAKAAGFAAATRHVTWQDVQSALRPAEAAIEFVHYRYMTPKETDSTMYAALVLLPGAAAPAFVPLCEERELTALLQGGSGGREAMLASIYRGNLGIVPDVRPKWASPSTTSCGSPWPTCCGACRPCIFPLPASCTASTCRPSAPRRAASSPTGTRSSPSAAPGSWCPKPTSPSTTGAAGPCCSAASTSRRTAPTWRPCSLPADPPSPTWTAPCGATPGNTCPAPPGKSGTSAPP